MKKLILKRLCYLAVLGAFAQACNVAYEYDIESGIDEYKGDSSNVTVDTLLSIDVTMYDRARIFPGLVDTLTERRIEDTTITLDLSRRYTDAFTMGVTAVPRPIYSTGLYAGAGELVAITVNEGVMGLSVQVGVHMDDLTGVGTALREPVVYTKKALFPGTNYIRNNLGGYIWIVRQGDVIGSDNYQLKFEHVYRAPDYVANTNMDPTAWSYRVRNTTVPWLELRGEHVAFSVSRARIASKLQEDPAFASKMEELLDTWDSIVQEYYYEYYGLASGSSDPKFRMPEFPERVILDVQLADNLYMRWTGQPIVALNTNAMMDDLTDLEALISGNSPNIFTALGNNYALEMSPWWPQVEDAANVIPLYRLAEKGFKNGLTDHINDIFTSGDGEDAGINHQFPLALDYAAADSSKWFRSDETTDFDAFALLPLIQLAYHNDNDWAFYTHLNKQMKGNRPSIGLDAFFGELCAYFGEDFSPFFDHWGIDLSDRARMRGRGYPLLDKTIWKYNPLSPTPDSEVSTYDVSGYKYKHDRTSWDVLAFDRYYSDNDQEDRDQGVRNILDGYKSSYWHTKWVGGTLPLPHYLVIDMKSKQQIDGFFFANGERQYRPSRMIIETTDAENIELSDMEVEWYKIAELRSVEDMANYSAADGVKPYEGLSGTYMNERYFEFIDKKNIRYIRVVFPDRDFVNSTHQTMAEFGTFYYK